MFISLIFINLNVLADEVDPIGTDPGFKSIQFQAIVLDKIKYPTYQYAYRKFDTYFRFSSNKEGYLSLENLRPETTPTVLISDVYTVYETYNGSYDLKFRDLTLASGDLKSGSKIVSHAFKRIEVNHMNVTRDDGSTYVAKGDAYIKMYDKNNKWIADLVDGMPTQNGIFVPVGYKYHIKVVAYTEDKYDTYEQYLDYTNL